MKLKYLWLAATATYASAQNEASFSGISADSAISIIEEQTEDLSDANYTTVRLEAVGHSNGDFFFLHDYPSSQFDGQTLSLNVNALQFTRDAEYFLPETKGYTAVGFFLTPTLKFRTRSWESFNVEAGAQVLGIAGDDHRLHVNQSSVLNTSQMNGYALWAVPSMATSTMVCTSPCTTSTDFSTIIRKMVCN